MMDYLYEEGVKKQNLLEKFGKEPMSKVEFAAYYSSLDKDYTVDEKTIRNKFKEIFEKYKSYVDGNPFFKKDIPPNIQKMLFVYLRSERLDRRKDKNNIISAENDNKLSKKLIDEYLDEEDKLFIKETPAYTYAEMESEINHLLKTWMNNTLYYIINLEPQIKIALINELSRSLSYVTSILEGYKIYSCTDKVMLSGICSDKRESQDELYEKIKNVKTIEEILEVCMIMRASGIEKDFRIEKLKKVTSVDMYLLTKHYHGMHLSEEKKKEYLQEAIELLDENKRYSNIIKRVKDVLDFNKAEDVLVYLLIEAVVEDLIFSYSMKEDGYKKVISLLKMAHGNNIDDIMAPLRKLLDNSRLNKD